MRKTQSGRSMVEMLGVLAIIGVLSVGGIAGYTMAMNRHRANSVIDTASKMAVISQSMNQGAGGTVATLGEVGLTAPITGVTMSADNGVVTLSGTALSAGVLKAMVSIAGDTKFTNNNTLNFQETD